MVGALGSGGWWGGKLPLLVSKAVWARNALEAAELAPIYNLMRRGSQAQAHRAPTAAAAHSPLCSARAHLSRR